MAVSPTEIIDLTEESPSRSLVPSVSDKSESSRKQKSRLGNAIPSSNSPIVISDTEEGASGSPFPATSGVPTKRRREKKRKKQKQTCLEGDAPQKDDNSNSFPLVNSISPQETRQPPDAWLPARRSPSPPLFYIDGQPDNPSAASDGDTTGTTVSAAPAPTKQLQDSLLLPDHVILDAAPLSKETSAVLEDESDSSDFIHFADAELNVFQRYYEEPKGESERKAHLVCGQCGAEGDHKRADCPILVCLTCGAHNEHSTRQCPIVRICFSCGMKGHVSRDCPDRHASRYLKDRDYECARCASCFHRTRECPTLWRVYEYMDDAEHDMMLKSRKEKENLPIGQGGEGYIGDGYWCYNCGEEGHLGDDCEVDPRRDRKEPSAFGSINVTSGPFPDREQVRTRRRRLRREWELDGNFDDGHGFAGPSAVGKLGRDKHRDRMRRREREIQEHEEDEEDWFGTHAQSKPNPHSSSPKANRRNGRIAINFQNGDDKDRRRPADRLLGRITSVPTGEERRQDDRRRRSISPERRRPECPADSRSGYNGDRVRFSDQGQRRDRHRDRDREARRERDHGPSDSGGNTYRSNRKDRSQGAQRQGRQYYGGYGR